MDGLLTVITNDVYVSDIDSVSGYEVEQRSNAELMAENSFLKGILNKKM